MTVAAVILAATAESALADAEGQPRVRRIVDAAWSGGAIPIIVVAPDPDGSVARALAGAPVTLAEPTPVEAGMVAQIVRGMEVAAGAVKETDAFLAWPTRFVWVGPETVTSLIEAHGTAPDGCILRPTFEGAAGWPVIVPNAHRAALAAMAAGQAPNDALANLAAAGAPVQHVDVGDPGAIFDAETLRADLPPYAGPAGPASGLTHEWGAAVADEPDDAPLTGPAIALLDDDA
jgi:CTP:molybdopterin cytidylyltransferase MocA